MEKNNEPPYTTANIQTGEIKWAKEEVKDDWKERFLLRWQQTSSGSEQDLALGKIMRSWFENIIITPLQKSLQEKDATIWAEYIGYDGETYENWQEERDCLKSEILGYKKVIRYLKEDDRIDKAVQWCEERKDFFDKESETSNDFFKTYYEAKANAFNDCKLYLEQLKQKV